MQYIVIIIWYISLLSVESDGDYASLPVTSLSQDSYPDFIPPPRPSLESSFSLENPPSSSAQASMADDTDGSGMSRSLDRRLL